MKTRIKTALSAVITAVIAALATAASAVPTITVDSVVQRWPWNNKVDITYTVGNGQDLAAHQYYKIVFTTVIDGHTYTIDGTTHVGASANTGTHTVTWTLPDGVYSEDCTMSAAVYTSDAPSGDDYMVVQLTGEDAGKITYEGLLATQEASNGRYNTATYKTDKLVLRKVAAGGPYRTGGTPYKDTNEYATNKRHAWTTDRDYYIGVFPVTQSQYTTIYGSNPSDFKTDAPGNPAAQRPVEKVVWYTVRRPIGDTSNFASTSSIPAVASMEGNFFQRLNFLTGRYFDLPTEVMFEIAQRANRTTCFSWGDEWDPDYVVFGTNTTVAVGSRLPNDWGLYDTSGNVWEWCLDTLYNDDSQATVRVDLRADAFTPGWDSTSEKRMCRGGSAYNSPAANATSGDERYNWPVSMRMSTRNNMAQGSVNHFRGFRVSLIAD